MSWLTQNLQQTATYWAPSGSDGFGNPTFASPITIKVRWEDRTDLFVNSAGQEKQSVARVYLDQDVKTGGYLYLGTSAASSPTGVSGSHEIKDFRKIPDLNAIYFERRALL